MSVWWSAEKVCEERERIEMEIKELEAEIKIKRAEFKVIQAHCKHPNKYSHTDYSGETDIICPDCKVYNPT